MYAWHFFDGDGNFENLLSTLFSTANRFLYANKHFPIKKFSMQKLGFFVPNVVLDTKMLAFFIFTFLRKR